jgi:hypothetical protein
VTWEKWGGRLPNVRQFGAAQMVVLANLIPDGVDLAEGTPMAS